MQPATRSCLCQKLVLAILWALLVQSGSCLVFFPLYQVFCIAWAHNIHNKLFWISFGFLFSNLFWNHVLNPTHLSNSNQTFTQFRNMYKPQICIGKLLISVFGLALQKFHHLVFSISRAVFVQSRSDNAQPEQFAFYMRGFNRGWIA